MAEGAQARRLRSEETSAAVSATGRVVQIPGCPLEPDQLLVVERNCFGFRGAFADGNDEETFGNSLCRNLPEVRNKGSAECISRKRLSDFK